MILFQGNQKNIRVSLSGRNNADSGLFRKKFERFPIFLVTHGRSPKKPIVFEIYVEFDAF